MCRIAAVVLTISAENITEHYWCLSGLASRCLHYPQIKCLTVSILVIVAWSIFAICIHIRICIRINVYITVVPPTSINHFSTPCRPLLAFTTFLGIIGHWLFPPMAILIIASLAKLLAGLTIIAAVFHFTSCAILPTYHIRFGKSIILAAT